MTHSLKSYYDRNDAFEHVQKQSRKQNTYVFNFKKSFRHERALTQLVWTMDKATQSGKCTLVEDPSSEYDQTCRLRDPIWVCSPTKNGDCKKMTYLSRRPDEVTCQRLNMDCRELNGDNRRAVTSSGPSPPPAAGAARKRKKYNELTSQEWIEAKPAALREIQKLMRELDVTVLSVRDNGIGSTWDTLYAWAAASTENTKLMMQSYAVMSKRYLSGASANGTQLATPNDIRNSVNAELRAAKDFMTFHETVQETLMSPAKAYHDMAWTDPFHNMHAEKLEAIAEVKDQLQPSWMEGVNDHMEQATAKLNAIADVFSYAISWLSWVYSWNECIAKKIQTSFGKDDDWALKRQSLIGFGLVSSTLACFGAMFAVTYYIVSRVASWFVTGMTQILLGLVVAAALVYMCLTCIQFAWDDNYDPILFIATMFVFILGALSYSFPEPARAIGDNRCWPLRWFETFAVWVSVFLVWLGLALGAVVWFDNMYVGFVTFALTAFLLFPCMKMKRFGDIGPALRACVARLRPSYWTKSEARRHVTHTVRRDTPAGGFSIVERNGLGTGTHRETSPARGNVGYTPRPGGGLSLPPRAASPPARTASLRTRAASPPARRASSLDELTSVERDERWSAQLESAQAAAQRAARKLRSGAWLRSHSVE